MQHHTLTWFGHDFLGGVSSRWGLPTSHHSDHTASIVCSAKPIPCAPAMPNVTVHVPESATRTPSASTTEKSVCCVGMLTITDCPAFTCTRLHAQQFASVSTKVLPSVHQSWSTLGLARSKARSASKITQASDVGW